MSFSGTLEHERESSAILSESDVLSSISTLRRVCESCFGPSASCHLIHNDVGGHVVVTSAAERMLSSLQVEMVNFHEKNSLKGFR